MRIRFLTGVALALVVLLGTPAGAALAKEAPPANAAPSAKGSQRFSFDIQPTPAWVVPAKENPGARLDATPIHFRMIDDQTKVDDKEQVMYSHVVRVIDSTAGLETAAQVEASFDPSYQKLVFHHVDVIRHGKRLNRLDRNKVQLLQRETQLERQMYDGRVTASLILSDVRVGDEIDFALSIRGSNPVFKGRYADVQPLIAFRGPTAVYQYRVIAPASRKIAYRVGPADAKVTNQVKDGIRELVFRRESVPMARFDTGAPYTAYAKHEVSLTEYEDWGDVARWGSTLFQNEKGDASPLDQKAAEFMAASVDPEQRVLAALRFVQKEIRYFGTETGMNSHQPAPVATVLAQRFGDCKDKTGLLVALLRRMDIAAWPVLVSTIARGHVEAELPSPLAFNHVIARVDLKGQTYWLDATRALQTGSLRNRQAISFERGLTLMPATDALSTLPSAVGEERAFLHDAFTVSKFSEPVRLVSRLTYRGEQADYIRNTVATKGLQDVVTQMGQAYIRAYPKIVTAAPAQLETSDTDDAVTLVQTFDIPDFWRLPEQRQLIGDAVHWLLLDTIRPPNEATRQDALALGYTGVFRQLTSVDYPEDVANGNSSARFEDGDEHVALKSVARAEPRRMEISSEVRVLKDELPADRFASYKTLFGKLGPRLVYTVSAPALSQARLDRLRQEATAVQDNISRGKLALATNTQVNATYRAMLLSAQLDEGRLNPALRAEVLTARGIQLDHLGRIKEAKADFAAALALSSDSMETLNAAATNAMMAGDYGQVVGFANRVLKTRPNDGEARQSRALARLYSQDYVSAKSDFEELVKDGDQIQRGYPLVWLGILAQRDGRQPMEAISAFRDSQLPRAWPRPLVDWMRGTKSLDELLADARKGEAAKEQLTEAYYYVGERYLAQGDVNRASDYFRKTLELKVVEFIEYGAALNRLAALKP